MDSILKIEIKSSNINEKHMEETKQQRYEKERKTVKTRFLFDKEYPKLLIAAEKAGYSKKEINKYLKYIALEGKVIIKIAPVKELDIGKKLLMQVRKLGSNLNQLTRRANESKESELNQDILDTILDLKRAMSKIESAFRK